MLLKGFANSNPQLLGLTPFPHTVSIMFAFTLWDNWVIIKTNYIVVMSRYEAESNQISCKRKMQSSRELHFYNVSAGGCSQCLAQGHFSMMDLNRLSINSHFILSRVSCRDKDSMCQWSFCDFFKSLLSPIECYKSLIAHMSYVIVCGVNSNFNELLSLIMAFYWPLLWECIWLTDE